MSLLNCANVLSRAGEKERENTKKSTRRSTDRRLGQTDLLNNSVENEKN